MHSQKAFKAVTPAKAGVQKSLVLLDSGLRRNDRKHRLSTFNECIKKNRVLKTLFVDFWPDLQAALLLVTYVDRSGGVINAVLKVILVDLLRVLEIVDSAHILISGLVLYPNKPLRMNILLSHLTPSF